ncbi:MAG: DUF6249 domain-containing protein [Vicinamibacterales bacterium]
MTAVAGILGVAALLAVAVHVYGRVQVERERTLQRLIERGLSAEELARIIGPDARRRRDLMRGLLLLAVGAAWAVVTFFVGGKAWALGAVPIALGLAYLAAWGAHGRRP